MKYGWMFMVAILAVTLDDISGLPQYRRLINDYSGRSLMIPRQSLMKSGRGFKSGSFTPINSFRKRSLYQPHDYMSAMWTPRLYDGLYISGHAWIPRFADPLSIEQTNMLS
ncbi:hypothetical protein RB195_026105 [Necator americanus]|uniref:Uncharacterized protein n=2 Tax=Necator americanus TaxID=51031 RepID=A0ABR1EXP7_NECAM